MAASRKSSKKTPMKISLSLWIIIILLLTGIGYAAGIEAGYIDEPAVTASKEGTITPDQADIKVHYIDVGQGDCELILAGDTSVLIDAGEAEYGEKVTEYLSSLNIKKLDYVVATHPHSDHIGGLPDVINSFEIGKILMPKITGDMTPTSKSYENLLNAIKSKGLKATAAKAGLKYTLPVSDEKNAVIEFVAPAKEKYDSLNNYSAVIKLTYGDVSFLFTGDAENEAEKDILASKANISADILKVGHHGSSSSSSKAFLDAVNPKLCIISVGEENSYNHPNAKTIERLNTFTDQIYRTDLNGTVIVYSDGKEFTVKAERGDDSADS
jgi:beta-lactamase superfamily II metal-dependent hydrolase